MPRPQSYTDEEFLAAYESTDSLDHLAETLGVSTRTVKRTLKRLRRPAKRPPHTVRRAINDATILEQARRCRSTRELSEAIGMRLKNTRLVMRRLGISFVAPRPVQDARRAMAVFRDYRGFMTIDALSVKHEMTHHQVRLTLRAAVQLVWSGETPEPLPRPDTIPQIKLYHLYKRHPRLATSKTPTAAIASHVNGVTAAEFESYRTRVVPVILRRGLHKGPTPDGH